MLDSRPDVELAIKCADESDHAALTGVFGQDVFFKQRLEMQSVGHGILLTAWSDGTPVGNVYLWLGEAEEEEIRAELPETPLINHLEVAKDCRNRGIGTAIMREAERILRELGHRRVALGVRLDNPDAARLYKRLGYQEWEREPITVPVGEDLDFGGPGAEIEVFTVLFKYL